MMSYILATLITFTWVPPTTGSTVDGYKLLIGSAPGNYSQTIDVGAGTTTQQDIDLATAKYFAVVAYNQWGDSTPSNEVTAGKPGAPATLTAQP